MPRGSNSIKQIAFCIAVSNSKEITKRDFYMFSQIIEVLKKVEERTLEKTRIEG